MCNGFCSLTTLCFMVFSNKSCNDNGTTLASKLSKSVGNS